MESDWKSPLSITLKAGQPDFFCCQLSQVAVATNWCEEVALNTCGEPRCASESIFSTRNLQSIIFNEKCPSVLRKSSIHVYLFSSSWTHSRFLSFFFVFLLWSQPRMTLTGYGILRLTEKVLDRISPRWIWEISELKLKGLIGFPSMKHDTRSKVLK